MSGEPSLTPHMPSVSTQAFHAFMPPVLGNKCSTVPANSLSNHYSKNDKQHAKSICVRSLCPLLGTMGCKVHPCSEEM